MDKTIIPGRVEGTVQAPPSKSCTHRAIICASLAGGTSFIKNFLESNDISATISAAQALGARIKKKGKALEITGSFPKAPPSPINCNESGSTARFFIPIAALATGTTELTGEKGLLKRPMHPIIDSLSPLGVKIESSGGLLPLKIHGGFGGGKISISGEISSQFLSGLLFACPLAQKESEISVQGRLESRPYVRITLGVMRDFGIEVDASQSLMRYKIKGGQKYHPRDYLVEGDFSSAAFLLAAGALAGDVEVPGLNPKSAQGDIEIISILKKMGAKISLDEGKGMVKACKSSLKGTRIDASDIPDLVPILAVLGACAKGETRIENAGRLRIKESDRLSSIASELGKMGAIIDEKKDGLVIHGGKTLNGAQIGPHGDHRIAMACAIAALCARGNTTIKNAEAVSKSYPDFFSDLEKLRVK